MFVSRLHLATSATGGAGRQYKVVIAQGADWLQQFVLHPWMWLAALAGFAGFAIAWMLGKEDSRMAAFIFSCLGITCTALTVGFGLYTLLLISAVDQKSSLTLLDASSSFNTLTQAFWITAIFLPSELFYTRWVHKVIWGGVSETTVLQDPHTFY